MLRLSDEFTKADDLIKKSLVAGQVGEYDGMPVVKVPAGRWPQNVNFMIVHRSSACMPMKIKETRIHQDPPGISGNLLEGRQYYDCFVFGKRACGIYVDVNTGSGGGTVMTAPTVSTAGVVTQSGASTIWATTDGSDPRYSKTRVAVASGSAPAHKAGDTVRAYAEGSGEAFPSPVAEAVTAS